MGRRTGQGRRHQQAPLPYSASGVGSRLERQWLAAVLATTAGLFASTLRSSVALGDSPESVAGVAALGVLHAPGYPTYVLAARLFSLLVPVGNLAFRVNLFSAVCATVTVGPSSRLRSALRASLDRPAPLPRSPWPPGPRPSTTPATRSITPCPGCSWSCRRCSWCDGCRIDRRDGSARRRRRPHRRAGGNVVATRVPHGPALGIWFSWADAGLGPARRGGPSALVPPWPSRSTASCSSGRTSSQPSTGATPVR